MKSVIVSRMLYHFINESSFKEAINMFLLKPYIKPDYLWQTLTMVAIQQMKIHKNVTVKELMSSWISQRGYPMLTLARDCMKKKLRITQQPYIMKELISSGDGKICWWIPLTYMYGDDYQVLTFYDPQAWLTCPHKKVVEIPLRTTRTWILANVQSQGISYYRNQRLNSIFLS